MNGHVDSSTQLEDVLEIDISDLVAAVLMEWLQSMIVIREFEEALDPLSLAGKIPGGVHTAVGQEGVAVGAIRALAPQDIVATSHRPHHHALAKGLSPRLMMAELFGRSTGYGGGRCGTMHVADFSRGYFGGNGIVGAGLGLAMGAALAAQIRDSDQVALGFFGEGGANTGRVWEAINMAALWRLPLIAVCENNLYAVETPVHAATAGNSIAQRAEGFGLPAFAVDGQDVSAMYRAVSAARARACNGEGPTFIEALTYRYRGHSTGQVMTYRPEAEVDLWRRTKDPIDRLRRALEGARALETGALEQMLEAARTEVAEAIAFAEGSPWPEPATADSNVTRAEAKVRANI